MAKGGCYTAALALIRHTMPYWFPHMLWECVAAHVTFHGLCQVPTLFKLEWEWEMVDVLGTVSVSLILTQSTCFYKQLRHYDGSINCNYSQILYKSICLWKTRKDPSCCHLFSAWKWLQWCINAFIVLKGELRPFLRITHVIPVV